MSGAYRSDLAYIHDAGFGQLASSGAVVVIDALKRSGIYNRTIVDLGCGSGITARHLCDAGFGVIGIDLSEALIEIARKRVPEAIFRIDSFVTANIPECVAVTAIGEVFNYAFDKANDSSARAVVLGRVYAALSPGGVLLFDMAGPSCAPSSNPQRTYAEGSD
jgi:SAM-dependent methyltransferase